MKNLQWFFWGIGLWVFVGVSAIEGQCGRPDWSNVLYEYYPGHERDARAATIIKVSEDNEQLMLVVYKSAFRNKNFYYTPEYFQTKDNGKSWQTLIGDQPQTLQAVPYIYFQSPSDPKTSYKLLSDLGLYLRSEDSGRTWALPQYSVDGKTPMQIADETGGRGYHLEARIVGVHPKDAKTLFAGMRVAPWSDSSSDLRTKQLSGLYKSVDGGEHWVRLTDEIHAFGLNWTQTSAVGVSPGNPDIIFAVGQHGIEKSENGGKTWALVGQAGLLNSRPLYRAEVNSKTKMLGAPVSQEVYEFLFDPNTLQTVYMLTNRGIYKTIDGGNSWRLLALGFDEIDAITTVALNPTNPDQIFVGSKYGIFFSKDGGCHFDRIPSPDGQQSGGKAL